ncbi:MAG TPA: outer membrane protein assembly factor BamE [Burkholderiales bacterium]|nr:outer membrane protein assembly factor BamE [Burkholderiales bacterium]
MTNARVIIGLAIIASFAFAVPAMAEDKFDGFLCCNMRTDGKWISDINYEESGKRIIAFGTPVKVIGYGRYRVRVVIEGRVQHIGNDYSRDLKREVFARRYVVPQDPRPAVVAMPEKIRKAIESAKVSKGMTKDQVLIAVGYPVSSENTTLDAPVWRYWLWSFSPFTVYFDDSGKVTRVDTEADTRPKVYLE